MKEISALYELSHLKKSKPGDLVERTITLSTILKSESKENLSEAQKPSDKNRVRN